MKKIIILIRIALSTTSILFAQKTPFEKFDSSKIDVGTLYIYDYSVNKEDFKPIAKGYLYIKSINNIEELEVSMEDTLEVPDIYKYKLNWDFMMLEKENYKYLGNINDLAKGYVDKMNLSIDFQKKTLKNKTFEKGKDELLYANNYVWKFNSIPTYFYQMTDLMPLWFALRFYPMGKEKITVNSLNNNYNTNFDIKYKGKENVKMPFGKVLCYKFELSPQLSFFMRLFHGPKKTFIYLTSEDSTRYMVKYRNNNEQYTEIQSMEYRLAERKKMTLEEWKKFKEKHGAKDTNFPKDSANTN